MLTSQRDWRNTFLSETMISIPVWERLVMIDGRRNEISSYDKHLDPHSSINQEAGAAAERKAQAYLYTYSTVTHCCLCHCGRKTKKIELLSIDNNEDNKMNCLDVVNKCDEQNEQKRKQHSWILCNIVERESQLIWEMMKFSLEEEEESRRDNGWNRWSFPRIALTVMVRKYNRRVGIKKECRRQHTWLILLLFEHV